MAENTYSKICDNCGTHPAVLFFRTFNGKEVGEEGLCSRCAVQRFSEQAGISQDGTDDINIADSINEMQHILSDIAGQITKFAEEPKNIKTCSHCGQTEQDILTNNKIGCSICAETFLSILKNKTIQHGFGRKHKGHIPQHFRHQHFKQLEIEKLKQRLFSLLREEAYEEAAKIHRRIQKLETTNN